MVSCKWNMQDIKKVGLTIDFFTCVQNKGTCSKLGTSTVCRGMEMIVFYDWLKNESFVSKFLHVGSSFLIK